MPEQSNEDSIVDGEMKNVKKIKDGEHNPYSNVDQWGRIMKLSCVYCGMFFRQKRTMKNHIDEVHGSGIPKKFHCAECDKYFKFSSQLKHHSTFVHEGKRLYTGYAL